MPSLKISHQRKTRGQQDQTFRLIHCGCGLSAIEHPYGDQIQDVQDRTGTSQRRPQLIARRPPYPETRC